jgi:carboxyl-terminal processing protease
MLMVAPGRLSRILVAGTVGLLVLMLVSGGEAEEAASPPPTVPAIDLALIRNVLRQVEQSYVEPVQGDALVAGALKGMLNHLDPHSEYMDEDEYQQMLSDSRGQIEGIGLDIDQVNGAPIVIAPVEGGPAARAGIRSGDRILDVDQQPIVGLGMDDLLHRLRGPAGSTVALTIARGQQPLFTVTLTRALIQVTSVTSALEANGIGYVRISQFTENTPTEVSDAITRLKRPAGKLAGFVLDLRDDPGGLLDASVSVASDFLDGGVVVSTHGRSDEDDDVYTAPDKGDLIPGTPMVVLINSYSASAAEIVAGALQDRRRATLLGTRSFGKGSVQTLFPLQGHGALRLTTALYFTPSGRSIQGGGITPDIVVPLPRDEREANAVVTHEGDLPGALATAASNEAKPLAPRPSAQPPLAVDDEAPIDPSIMGTPKDDQLSAALKFVQGQAMMKAAFSPR